MPVNNIEVTERLISVTGYILNSVSEDGSWRSPEHEAWGPIITVLNVDHLLSCGMKIDDEWPVDHDGQIYSCSINKCLEYLNSQINLDGSFGADFWDSCKMAALVSKCKLQMKISNFVYLEEYIKEKYAAGYLSSHDYDWAGPGVYAACADYYSLIGQTDVAKIIIDNAITLQKSDGSFVGKEKSTGGYIVSPVWHTSQVIMTIKTLSHRFDFNEDIINNANQYLIDKQNTNGGYDDFASYGIYYTSYAILGFLAFPNRHDNLRKALTNLMSSVSGNGKAGDFGGTIMVALAFGKYLGADVNSIFETLQIRRNKALLVENKELKQKVEELNIFKARYSDADIVLTKKEAWKWSILIAVFLALVMFVIPVLTDLVKSTYTAAQQTINKTSNTLDDSSVDNSLIILDNDNGVIEKQ